MEISTSILSIKKEEATQIFYNIETAKTDYFHIDVMDGKFVEKNTLEFMKESAQTIKHISNLPLDIHLMVKNPKECLNDYISLNPGFITVHVECDECEEAIEIIKNANIKVGLAIKPATEVKKIEKLIQRVNMVLVMTVEPGYGGQAIIPETIKKVDELYKYREENNLDYYIEVDGGINLETIETVKNAGADIAVCRYCNYKFRKYE